VLLYVLVLRRVITLLDLCIGFLLLISFIVEIFVHSDSGSEIMIEPAAVRVNSSHNGMGLWGLGKGFKVDESGEVLDQIHSKYVSGFTDDETFKAHIALECHIPKFEEMNIRSSLVIPSVSLRSFDRISKAPSKLLLRFYLLPFLFICLIIMIHNNRPALLFR
jgi:hypothetical protein